jgi:hypothetical protein
MMNPREFDAASLHGMIGWVLMWANNSDTEQRY